MCMGVGGVGIDDEVSYRRENQAPSEDYWTHRDDLNTLTNLTDESGVVVERYEYGDYGKMTILDPAGVERVSTIYDAQHLYTGRPLIGGAGLQDSRFRVLDMETGRFVQRDPLGFVDGMNLYVYVVSSPHVYSDAMGLSIGPQIPFNPDAGGTGGGPPWNTTNNSVNDLNMGSVPVYTGTFAPVRTSDTPYSWQIDVLTTYSINFDLIGKGAGGRMRRGTLATLRIKRHSWRPATFDEFDILESDERNGGSLVGARCRSKKNFSGDCTDDCGNIVGRYSFEETLEGVVEPDSLGRYFCDTSIAEGELDKSSHCP